MPPAIIAIAAAVATAIVPFVISSAVVAAIVTVAIAVAATIAMSLGRKPADRTASGEELRLKLDPGMPRQIILGRSATGGSVVWAFTYGSASHVPSNAFLVRIIAISDLPCTGLVGIFEGKTQLSFLGDVTTGLRACSQHKTDGGQTRMWARVYLGSPNAVADGNLVSWSGGRWTSAHKGTNMCYAIVQYQYDQEGNAFPNGEPQLTFVMDGVAAYDQRQDGSRPGRTGGQRLALPSTWAYTRNAAVQAQQILRGFYSNNVLLIGAQAEERDLDDAMLVSAYNTCDEPVSNGALGTQPRYQAGFIASSNSSVADILVQLQAAMDGKIIDRGGNITIRPGATHTPVFTLTDDDLMPDMEKSWQPRLGISEVYNFVDGVFVDEQTLFQEKPFPPLRSTAYEAQDGGQRFEFQIAYGAATDWSQVQRMTKRIHLQSRLQGTVAFFLPLWGIEMEQDDWFVMSSVRWGFTNKYFQCMNADLVMSPGLCMAVVARETAATIDGWNPAVDEKPRGDTAWTGAAPSPLPVPTITAVPIQNTAPASGTELYGVQLTISNLGPNPALANNLELQLVQGTPPVAAHRPTSAPKPGVVILPSPSFFTPVALQLYGAYDQVIEYYGLLGGTQYSIRGRTLNEYKQGAWGAWTTFFSGQSVVGYSLVAPPTVTFQANSDGSLNPTAQLPKVIGVDIVKAGTSAGTSDYVDYAITTAGCTATIDNTDGSPTKGQITITAVSDWTAFISVSALAWGVELPAIRIDITKTVAASGGGGTSPGGVGSKTAKDSELNAINSTSFIALTDVMTVTLAAGESLYGTGNVGYGGTATKSLTAKWQYSAAGANSWTDFPGSPVTGSPVTNYPAYHETFDGNVALNQTKGGLSAGNYDVRVVAATTPTGTATLNPYGTLTITAKV
jgi:hypothetical protein